MWTEGTETCPRCNNRTEDYIIKIKGHEYNTAERCTTCKWQINQDEVIMKVNYGSPPPQELWGEC